MATLQNRWQRQQVKAGKCAQGCGRTRGRSSWYCDPCLEINGRQTAARVQRFADKGKCRCGNTLGDYTRCDDCRARENAARRKR